ncbi:hypothetical protein SAMD00019534_118410, partial [Acytostelium subglobosum LB1]|uniref:hypothetical protein n=1 Tax=Acytostelium subglobosum LB1 TaxID=1410327 RepID=UPI000644CAC6
TYLFIHIFIYKKIMTQQMDTDYPTGGSKLSTAKKIAIGVVVVALAVLLILLCVFLIPRNNDDKHTGPLNVIVFIPDGFGPSGATLARVMKNVTTNGGSLSLNFDPFLVGTVRTRSASSLVTDSAAAASAYSTGYKTINDALGVDAAMRPLGTMFEAAKTKGMKTGLVVTTRISDATPSAFYAHSATRENEAFIISQWANRGINVALGGGKKYFNSTILEQAANNYTIVFDKESMANVTKGNILGLFARKDMPYEIDRVNDPQYSHLPSLAEMTTKALELISQNNDKGFILLVEGSKIDLAGHDNDAFTHWRETLAFDSAFQVGLDFAKKDKNTVIVMMADHETGGLTLGFQPDLKTYPDYLWIPELLTMTTASATAMTAEISAMNKTTNATVITGYINTTELLVHFYGIEDWWSLAQFIGRYMSERAWVGFTTGGHTGSDINLYNHYTGSDDNVEEQMLHGNYDNTDIARYLESILHLDLAAETAKLVNTPVK